MGHLLARAHALPSNLGGGIARGVRGRQSKDRCTCQAKKQKEPLNPKPSFCFWRVFCLIPITHRRTVSG